MLIWNIAALICLLTTKQKPSQLHVLVLVIQSDQDKGAARGQPQTLPFTADMYKPITQMERLMRKAEVTRSQKQSWSQICLRFLIFLQIQATVHPGRAGSALEPELQQALCCHPGPPGSTVRSHGSSVSYTVSIPALSWDLANRVGEGGCPS